MPYSCPTTIADTHYVGEGWCVDLVRTTCNMPSNFNTPKWRPGAQVKGNLQLQPGTAIATFIHGVYPDPGHAAIYLGQDAKGIRVKQQYKFGLYPLQIHEADIKFGGRGTARAGDDADNYYVIE